jgi:hypothetical protein
MRGKTDQAAEGAMAKSKTRKRSKFQRGSHGGCEALLWEFRERSLSVDSEADLQEKPVESKPRVVLIAAETLDEALKYLRFDSSDFEIHTVNCLGLIIMVSGSPLN